MAFDTLGVNVVASGIKGVAADIGSLAHSFLKYVNAVKQADAASIKAAQSQSKLADTMAGKAVRSLSALEKKQVTLTTRVRTLRTALEALNLTMRDPISAQANYEKAINDARRYEQAILNFTAAMRKTEAGTYFKDDIATLEVLKQKLAQANLELSKQAVNLSKSITEQAKLKNTVDKLTQAEKELAIVNESIAETQQLVDEASTQAAESHDKVAEAVEKAENKTFGLNDALDLGIGLLNDSNGAVSALTSVVAGLSPKLSMLAGGVGQTAGASASLSSTLGVSTGALAGMAAGLGAVVAAIGVAKVAFKALQTVVDAAVKVVKIAWDAFKKLAGIVLDVAKAVGKTLWNALTKIVSAPFKLISNLFDGIFGSMQRVMEMAIGMNASRIWWQLGMKMRDMFKDASDSATEYQVTFNRLRSLTLNEILGQLGRDISSEQYTAALKQANIATEELVMWTSKLAVSTIYDAEDILNVYTLAMSYGFASTQAEKLTKSVLDFATGMGLGDTEMRRIIENFGQMRAQGKITGTELRDLARGSFVPVNDVLEQMAKNVGLVGDYDIPNMQEVSNVLKDMAENGELSAEAFAAIDNMLKKIGSDGKITRQEFETLVQDLSQEDVMQRFGLSAEQAGKALEGIKTGQLTAELNELIQTGELTIDEFFEAFIDMAENKYPNAAMSMGMTMKAVKSNIQDYIDTMIGWRLIAPVFEVVAKHVQSFIQGTLMNEQQIALFDKMGKAFKTVTELVMTYSEAVLEAKDLSTLFFGAGPLQGLWKFTKELAEIIGSLGTEEFAKQFDIFELAIKSIGLTSESRNIVLTGIQTLNDIMADIMAGVEVDPEILGKTLDDVFGTLWREYFAPTMKDGLAYIWDEVLMPGINNIWRKMKDAFAEWKTEDLMPGIKEFFSVTLPGWISGISTWLEENGPGVIIDIGTFVSDILAELEKTSEFHFGENHPLTLLLRTLEDLTTYATFKLADPTAEINQENLDDLAGSFESLKGSLLAIAEENLLNSEPVKKFMDAWNKPEVQGILEALTSLFNTIGTVVKLEFAPSRAFLESLGALVGVDVSGNKLSTIQGLATFMDKLAAAIGVISLIPSAGMTVVSTVFDTLGAFLQSIADYNWGNAESFTQALDGWFRLFAQYSLETPSMDWLVEMIDDMIGLVDKVLNVDMTAFRQKIRDFYNAIREFLGLEPVEFPPLDVEFDMKFTPNLIAPEGYGAWVDEDGNVHFDKIKLMPGLPGKGITIDPIEIYPQIVATPDFVYNGPAGWYIDKDGKFTWISPGTVTADPVEYVIPTIISLDTKDQGGKAIDSKVELIEGWLAGDWGEPPISGRATSVSVPVELEILPKEGGEGGKKVLESIVSDMSTVIAEDTSVPNAGATMMDNLSSAISGRDKSIQKVVANIAQNMDDPLNSAVGTFTAAGANIVQGLWNGLASKIDALISWWEDKISYLNSIIPNMAFIRSPSKLYYEYGENIMNGLKLGLASGQEGAVAQMHDAAIELRQALGAINTGTISPQQYNNVSNTTNWNVNVTTPLVASTPIQAYEILRMRAR